MSDIVVVGSLNADLVASVERAPGPGETITGESFATYAGGKGANQAYAAGRLGASVSMIGRVGNDPNGAAQMANLSSVGVMTERVRIVAQQPTGTAIIVVEKSGENRIVVVPGANGAFSVAELDKDPDAFGGSRFALFQLEIPLETVAVALAEAKGVGAVTILDPAPAQPLPENILNDVDILTPNLSELALLTGKPLGEDAATDAIEAASQTMLEKGVKQVMAKLGSRGALLVTRGRSTPIAGYRVEAVDTTAAGDCFNAAFAVALNRGDGFAEAGRFACAAAAVSVTRPGAQASMPSLQEVAVFLKEHESGGL